jgi:hypothetical protein
LHGNTDRCTPTRDRGAVESRTLCDSPDEIRDLLRARSRVGTGVWRRPRRRRCKRGRGRVGLGGVPLRRCIRRRRICRWRCISRRRCVTRRRRVCRSSPISRRGRIRRWWCVLRRGCRWGRRIAWRRCVCWRGCRRRRCVSRWRCVGRWRLRCVARWCVLLGRGNGHKQGQNQQQPGFECYRRASRRIHRRLRLCVHCLSPQQRLAAGCAAAVSPACTSVLVAIWRRIQHEPSPLCRGGPRPPCRCRPAGVPGRGTTGTVIGSVAALHPFALASRSAW